MIASVTSTSISVNPELWVDCVDTLAVDTVSVMILIDAYAWAPCRTDYKAALVDARIPS